MVAVQVVEVAAALDRNAHAAEAVVADGRRYRAGHLLLVVGEESVGRGIAARLLDARPLHAVPVLLQQVAVVVLHLRQPVLRFPDERLLACEPLVARGHVTVVVEADRALYPVNRMVRLGVVIARPV